MALRDWMRRKPTPKPGVIPTKVSAKDIFLELTLAHALPKDKRDAEDRAAQLLWNHLNDEQRSSILQDRYFVVKKGPYKMSLFTNHINAVTVGGRSLCIHTYDYYSGHGCALPFGDILLTKKLAFEADPVKFYRIGVGKMPRWI